LIYLDTSVVVAFYVPEPASTRAERAVRSEPCPAISDLTEVEFFSAVARKVREGGLSPEDAGRVMATLLSHLAEGLYARIVLEPMHYRLARDWFARFAVPLRTLDALHLAVASASGAKLVTADRALSRAARALGLESVLVRRH